MGADPRRRRRGRGERARSYARWIIKARPLDYLLALSAAPAEIPVVGRHLKPIGGFAAMTLWAPRFAPDFVAVAFRGRLAPGNATKRRLQQISAGQLAADALKTLLSEPDLAMPWPAPQRVAPVRLIKEHRRFVYRESVRYGDHPAQLLDVWRRDGALPRQPAPVLLFLPGGAWVFGSRKVQGHALMAQLAEAGWVCLSIQYRTGPHHRWPRQIIDVKAAIAWARANVDRFGGNPEFVAISGCSAGGHLASLAGLTLNDPVWQQKLGADANTSVDAVVSIYGSYDWEDRSTAARGHFMDFLERVVVKRRQVDRPHLFTAASPIARVHRDAPPFLVLHGTNDVLIPVSEARTFVERLRQVSSAAVTYIELPGAMHGFDLLDGLRTGPAVTAIERFLNHVHRQHNSSASNEVG